MLRHSEEMGKQVLARMPRCRARMRFLEAGGRSLERKEGARPDLAAHAAARASLPTLEQVDNRLLGVEMVQRVL